MRQFKVGDKVIANWPSYGRHPMNIANGTIMVITGEAASWLPRTSWIVNGNTNFYWEEDWLLPVNREKLLSGFGKWVKKHGT